MALLTEVQRLQEALGVAGDVAYTCETARHFYIQHVLTRWQAYLAHVTQDCHKDVAALHKHFPFHKFFSDAPQPLFKSRTYEEDLEIAQSCFRLVNNFMQIFL